MALFHDTDEPIDEIAKHVCRASAEAPKVNAGILRFKEIVKFPFACLIGKNYVAVVDKEKLTVLSIWPIREAEQNAPVAFDEPNKRLFIITRKPGKLIVLNAETGASIASFKAPERCDQVIWDAANRRIYALGGEGYIGVFEQKDANSYEELPHVPSAPGAKTGILIPELKRLYVAVSPGEAKTGAAILRYDVAPAAN